MTTTTITKNRPPKSITSSNRLVCFSFAAYAKNLMLHLRCLNIPILPGLTDTEFTFLESTLRFSFPPDLRSILQEGLPVGPHFPNWRSSSHQQLHILLNLPTLKLSKNISQHNFWVDSWGQKPDGHHEDNGPKALAMAEEFLDKAPVLVPIYGNCYIPCTPNLAGNPVFYIDDEIVRVLSFDITRFFQEVEFWHMGSDHHHHQGHHHQLLRPIASLAREEGSAAASTMNMPAWAATTAREIRFWTEVAERGRRVVEREETRGWWVVGRPRRDERKKVEDGLSDCLEEVFWRLRDGGWREEEVREMMVMDGGGDDDDDDPDDGERRRPPPPRQNQREKKKKKNGVTCGGAGVKNKEEVLWRVRVLSMVLLRAGWSRKDVMYSLGLQEWECKAADEEDRCYS
ncbi:hypothetical protein Tsubulata_000252 [Turnera subulata]|uniref:Uncharacterized protein n=1 Tax=Turnera subulata TaxID=218843 RepID=A0A9Q0FYQ3_9ROSI|nr:hypothetical protein Tsubulata_000252 [Turnera subulata]